MKPVVDYFKLWMPRSPEQRQVRCELALLSQHLEIEASQRFHSPMASDALAAQSIKGAGKAIGLLTVIPRTSFRTMAPKAIEAVRTYFKIAQGVLDEHQIESHRMQFERLAGQLQP
jgi:hypothetical protein